MPERIKIKTLCAEGFRGILKKIWLDFEDDAKSLVLFGNNGDGKSSFSDALEWFYTDKINDLGKEGCGRDDYFNDALPKTQDATVEVSFVKNSLSCEKILQRGGGYRCSNSTAEFIEYTENASRESFILRYDIMREFVNKRKTEKLEEVEGLIGFEIVKDVRAALLKASNALRSSTELTLLQAQLNERGKIIIGIIGIKPFSQVDVIAFAEELRKQLECDQPIYDIDTMKLVTDKLQEKVKTTEKGEQIAWLQGVQENVTKFREIVDFLRELKQVLTSHNELANQRDKVEAEALSRLYEAGAEVLEKGRAKAGQCPLCKQPVDTEKLLQHLRQEIESISDLLEERKKILDRIGPLRHTLSQLEEALSKLSEDKVKESLLASDQFEVFKTWHGLLPKWMETIDRATASLDSLHPELPSKGSEETLTNELAKLEERIKGERNVLAGTDEEKRFYQNAQNLRILRDSYLEIIECENRIRAYDVQKSSLEKVLQEFEKKEREGLSKVLNVISRDVNEYFQVLHPGEDLNEIELIPTEKRGLEFKLKFFGRPVSPPLKVLSESHLNSLGISLFLASAKRFNKTNGFLILDDVVSSFDVNHRRSLARLLREMFGDVQFLLFTHDDLWFDQLKLELPQNRWLFKELAKWCHESGVDVIESPMTLRERIQRCLDTNDISGAANKCRILIEGILKEKCENLGVPLEARFSGGNDRRAASELIDGLAQYLNANKSLRAKDDKSKFSDLRADQLLTNIGSHHTNLGTTSLARGDIELILKDLDAFKTLFVCPACTKQAMIDYSPKNSKLKQCKCGALRI